MSGNTIWPFRLSKIRQIDHFWHFCLTFGHSKCKRSSLLSLCCMRPFLWFLNTVSMRKQIRKKIVMSVQIILSFRKCDKSHIQAFHVFFWASFSSYPVLIWRTWEQLTHHLVSHNSLSFHNQRKKTKLKVVLGETFFESLESRKKNWHF